MKLLFCLSCNDIFRLTRNNKSCTCGETNGKYIDNINVEIHGNNFELIGFNNSSFINALKKHKVNINVNKGINFDAFFIPKDAKSVIRKK